MTMKSGFISLLALTTIAGTAVMMTPTALAQSSAAEKASARAIVKAAIKQGVVGETAEGYLALTDKNVPAAIVEATNEINIGRKSVYTKLARKQNVQVEVIAALTGEKQLAKAEAETKILTKSGRWITVK